MTRSDVNVGERNEGKRGNDRAENERSEVNEVDELNGVTVGERSERGISFWEQIRRKARSGG